jgi:hypothetical protein
MQITGKTQREIIFKSTIQQMATRVICYAKPTKRELELY